MKEFRGQNPFLRRPIGRLSALKDGTGGGTVSSDIGAIFCGAVCSDKYPYGDTVLLYATPSPTSLFTGQNS